MFSLVLEAGGSINEALSRLPASGMAELILKPGVFREKVEVSRANTCIVGASPETTKIVYSDYANAVCPSDGLPYNTFRTATVRVSADNVSIVDLCIENDAVNPGKNGQCVALYAYGDNFSVRGCKLVSTQDTLFAGPLPDDLVVRYMDFLPDAARYREGALRQRYEGTKISGSVDFIFGCAEAVFSHCTLMSVFDGRDGGFIAAPAHSLKQKSGFTFVDCDMTSDGRLSDGSVFLARPWRDFGKSAFIRCRLGAHIAPELFDKWNDTERNRTARFSYHALCGRPVSPVEWSHELTGQEAEAYLARAF